MADHSPTQAPEAEGPSRDMRADLLSGFLVFLIAMPLCLAIAKASGFPPITGIWTAVLGGIICTLISNSELTIKGPAAGLIVIVAGAVGSFGAEFVPELSAERVAALRAEGKSDQDLTKALEEEQAWAGYRLALGVGLVSGLCQIAFGLLRAGKLGDFFPQSAVHGLLASIGIIIISKQAYPLLGADPPREPVFFGPIYSCLGWHAPHEITPLDNLFALPSAFLRLNPEIAAIGLSSLAILFGLPLIARIKVLSWVKKVPAPMVVLLLAVPLGRWFDLDHKHTYLFPNSFFDTNPDHMTTHEVGPRFLVDMPNIIKEGPAKAFAFPDFRGVLTLNGLKWLALFAIIGSLESLLSAKAIDLLDPWARKTNFNRDLLGVGVANTVSASIGGMPMISEIVRSSANINNGARTRLANLFHGLFLLGFVVLLPDLIREIPLAALGAMLVFTGFRLASPAEFVTTWKIGPEQLAVFLSTLLVTLATDLLVGIASGIALKVLFLFLNRVPAGVIFRPDVSVSEDAPGEWRLTVRQAAVFTNWLGLRTRIESLGLGAHVTVDLSQTGFVDHTVMERLHELWRDFGMRGRRFEVTGLDGHKGLSAHPNAARRKAPEFTDAAG